MGEKNVLFHGWTAAEFRCLCGLEGTLWFGDELNSSGYQNRALRTVLIDPEANNSRAIHVYEKAGFQLVSEFVPSDGAFQGKPHVLMAYHYYQTKHSRI